MLKQDKAMRAERLKRRWPLLAGPYEARGLGFTSLVVEYSRKGTFLA